LGASNMDDLRLKLHSNLILEKTYEAGNKFTQDVLDTLYKKTTVSLPNKLIHDDLEKRKQKKAEDLEKIGLDLEGFAKQQKMTLEELENKWLEDIEKEYTLEFAIAEIGEKENVTVSDEEVDSEINASKSSETMQLFQDPHRKEHLRYLMRRDKVIGKIVEMNFPELEKDSDKEEQKPKKKTKKS
ncbi:hypothetical protein KC571_04075, partial [candidate division WWE3 bacterium]|nr:hypothetical protein [candidate division WWE3 bacterium]